MQSLLNPFHASISFCNCQVWGSRPLPYVTLSALPEDALLCMGIFLRTEVAIIAGLPLWAVSVLNWKHQNLK